MVFLVRFFIILVGFGFSVIGFMYCISYLNLLSLGYNFHDYVNFINDRVECLLGFLGFFIMTFAIFIPKKTNINNSNDF